MAKIGIIFDMDGTLWDSARNVALSWTEVVKRNYPDMKEITEADIKGVMGLTMDKIADALFPKLGKKKRMSLLNECCEYENEYLRKHGGILYPVLRGTLGKLKPKYGLYIVSNCQSGYIEAFLDFFNLGNMFDDIECYGNNNLSKGENIKLVMDRNNLDEAYYVGDIQGDYDSSVEAGAKFIHAAYGFGKINADVPKINKFSELVEVLHELTGR